MGHHCFLGSFSSGWRDSEVMDTGLCSQVLEVRVAQAGIRDPLCIVWLLVGRPGQCKLV